MPLLLEAHSSRWKLEISGPVRELPGYLPAVSTTVEVDADAPPVLRAWKLSPSSRLETVQPGAPLPPVFFENTDYHLYFTAENDGTRLHLPPAARLIHRSGTLSHYAINFRNDVGYVEIGIESAAASATIRLEVSPSKLDYRKDYVQMRDEVAGIARNLVLWVQARTFGLAAPTASERPTLIEWRSLMEAYFDELMSAGRAIARSPHSELIKIYRAVPPERSRRVDERALDRLARRALGRPGGNHPLTGTRLPARVPEVTRRVTYDTPVNRYVKAVLLETARKLKRVIQTETTGDEDADRTAEQKFFDAFRPNAGHMLRQLRGLLREPFLQEAATVAHKRPASLVLAQHPHYAALEKAARKINSGLEAGGGLLRVGLKNIALLYEYWCFLRLVELLREHFDLDQQDVVRVKHLEFAVVLQKGVESTIRFRDRSTGKEVRLVYNRLFSALPTTAQQPDNVIQLLSEDELFIFDAKYRLSYDSPYQRKYDGPGPRASDINTMHRYRDAIVLPRPDDPNSYAKVVSGAVVLFPHLNEQEYRRQKFYRSIGSVRIGGLPFLPTATNLVRQELEGLIKSYAGPKAV